MPLNIQPFSVIASQKEKYLQEKTTDGRNREVGQGADGVNPGEGIVCSGEDVVDPLTWGACGSAPVFCGSAGVVCGWTSSKLQTGSSS